MHDNIDSIEDDYELNAKEKAFLKFVADTIDTQAIRIISPKLASRILAISSSLDDHRTVFESMRIQLLRNNSKSYINEIIEAGLLPVIIQNLEHPDPKLEFECAFLYGLVFTGMTNQAYRALDADVTVALIEGIQGVANARLCWLGLANIVGRGGIASRDYAIECGIINMLYESCRTEEFTEEIALAMSNVLLKLCYYKRSQIGYEIQLVILYCLFELLRKCPCDGIKRNVCDTFAALCNDDDEQLVFLDDYCVLEDVIPLLTSSTNYVVSSALSVFCGFARGSTKQAVLKYGFLGHAYRILSSSDSLLHANVCDVLANILNGTEYEVQEIINAGLIPFLVKDLEHEAPDVTCNAILCFYNICEIGSQLQIRRIAREGLILAITPCLSVEHAVDDEFKYKILLIIEVILNVANNPLSGELYQYMDQFRSKGGLDILDTIWNTGTEDMQAVALNINCFYSVLSPCAAA